MGPLGSVATLANRQTDGQTDGMPLPADWLNMPEPQISPQETFIFQKYLTLPPKAFWCTKASTKVPVSTWKRSRPSPSKCLPCLFIKNLMYSCNWIQYFKRISFNTYNPQIFWENFFTKDVSKWLHVTKWTFWQHQESRSTWGRTPKTLVEPKGLTLAQ